MNSTRHLQIATEIKRQIPIMTHMACGSREFIVTHDANDNTVLRFRVGDGKRGLYISVTLEASDTYTVRLLQMKRKTHELITQVQNDDVYAEDLGEIVYHMVNK